MEVYTKIATLRSPDAGAILSLLQEAASEHMNTLSLGVESMAQLGLFWAVVRQRFVLTAPLLTPQVFAVRTWLADGRHGLFPRHYFLADKQGVLRCRAETVWSLVDRRTRTFGKVPQTVAEAPKHWEAGALPRLTPLRAVTSEQTVLFTVPPQFIDENGHMNNARYPDAALSLPARPGQLAQMQIDYHAEALPGETLTLRWRDEEAQRFIQGEKDGRLCCRMKLNYAVSAAL